MDLTVKLMAPSFTITIIIINRGGVIIIIKTWITPIFGCFQDELWRVRTSHQKIMWILVELHFVVKYVLYMHAIIHLNIIIKKKDIDTKRRTPLFG